MATPRAAIDIDDEPDLIRLVDHIQESDIATILRRKGEAVALVTPLAPASEPNARRRDPAETLRVLQRTAGAWQNLIDADKLIEDIYAARDAERRQFPEL